MMDNNNLIVGLKFFKYDDNDKLEIIRIMELKNNFTIAEVKNETTGEKRKIETETLRNEYTMLAYDGLLCFSIVKVHKELEDVIVSLFRKKDIDMHEPMPYAVCRQGITDIFANQIKINNKEYYGASVSQDTIPVDVPFNIMVACDKIEDTKMIAVYIDDKFDDILKLIKTKKYDAVINYLFNDYINYKSKTYGDMYKNNVKNKPCVDGYCKNLRDLLDFNNFMYDFYRGYNIIPISFDLSSVTDNETTLNEFPDVKKTLENLLCAYIENSLIVKFAKDLDLESIQGKYLLVSDINEDLYVIAYTESPVKYIVDADDVNIGKDTHHEITSSDVMEAYLGLRLNKIKYE